MKRLFSILIAVVAFTTVYAEKETALVLELNDGTKNEFIFSEKPIITMPNDTVKVTSTTLTVGYKRSNVNRFYFNPNYTAIKTVKADGNNIIFNCQNRNNIHISGLQVGQFVSVYNMSGQLLNSTKASSNGEANISLNSYNCGAYIIRCGNKSFKITL